MIAVRESGRRYWISGLKLTRLQELQESSGKGLEQTNSRSDGRLNWSTPSVEDRESKKFLASFSPSLVHSQRELLLWTSM